MSGFQWGEGSGVSFGRADSIEKAFETHVKVKEQSSWSDCLRAFRPLEVVLTVVLCMAGCAITGTKASESQTPIISVSITQAPPSSLPVGNMAPVSSAVSNDPEDAAVDW